MKWVTKIRDSHEAVSQKNGRFMGYRPDHLVNVELVIVQFMGWPHCFLITTRPINAGEELLRAPVDNLLMREELKDHIIISDMLSKLHESTSPAFNSKIPDGLRSAMSLCHKVLDGFSEGMEEVVAAAKAVVDGFGNLALQKREGHANGLCRDGVRLLEGYVQCETEINGFYGLDGIEKVVGRVAKGGKGAMGKGDDETGRIDTIFKFVEAFEGVVKDRIGNEDLGPDLDDVEILIGTSSSCEPEDAFDEVPNPRKRRRSLVVERRRWRSMRSV
ncbi:hypothetical protein BC829DRAFT_175811 [Chytridium lagenaria]|nr:hypothetical protein BC829DRAFT_175811 [Chytridium lagenaria]